MNLSLGYYVFHKSTLHMLILLPNFSWLIKGFSISWCHYGLKLLEYWVLSLINVMYAILLPNFWLQNYLRNLKYTKYKIPMERRTKSSSKSKIHSKTGLVDTKSWSKFKIRSTFDRSSAVKPIMKKYNLHTLFFFRSNILEVFINDEKICGAEHGEW